MLTAATIIADLNKRADALDYSRVNAKHGEKQRIGLFIAARALRVASEQYAAGQLFEPGDAVASVEDIGPSFRKRI